MGVRKRDTGDATILSALGDFFGGAETDELREAIRSELRQGHLRLVLDFSRCGMVNTNALSAIVEARSAYVARGGELKLSGVGKRLGTALEVTRLIELLDVYETVEEALAAFQPRARIA